MSRVKFSKLTDEEIHEIMESGVTSGEEDSNSGNDSGSLNHEPEEISPEDEHLISLCLRGMDTSANFSTRQLITHLQHLQSEIPLLPMKKTFHQQMRLQRPARHYFLANSIQRRELVRRYQDPKAPVQPLCQPMVVLMA